MGVRNDLKREVQRAVAGDDPPLDRVEAVLLDARDRLIGERDRLGDAAADALVEFRDEAGEVVHQARRRARRIGRRALRRSRADGGGWRGTGLALLAVAGASAIGVALVKERRSLRTAAASAAKTVRTVAAQAVRGPRAKATRRARKAD